jgi:hypothetical protein
MASGIVAVWALALGLAAAAPAGQTPSGGAAVHASPDFQTSDNCLACHNSLTTSSGEDVSIGPAWRGSMMANSSRDPYWQAAVRRETIDHPSHRAEIEDECTICHMPMTTASARQAGRLGQLFAHLPIGVGRAQADRQAADGVSCTVCHQIGPDRLGTPESFTGGFVVEAPSPDGGRRINGPFDVDAGRSAIMRSVTGVGPAEAPHIRQSELCATCHTLITHAFGPDGQVVGRLPEQVPYLEWRHSALREQRSCQACHMPEVDHPTPIASVLGEPREGFSRHTFIGGNFFILRMLNRFRTELGVEALPHELEAAARATVSQLQTTTASVSIERAETRGGRLDLLVGIVNLTGHKLPTGYPSRRVWLHVTVRDRTGRVHFESGAPTPSGAIVGNDNDSDAGKFEPHYLEITRPDEVQIYESVMADPSGALTTGLLRGVSYVKDNRLLPRGFDKATAEPDIAVRGGAAADADFTGDGDRIRYLVDLAGSSGPFEIEVELRYQPIAFRWAQNLRPYNAAETRRFVTYYESMSAAASEVVSRTSRRAD